MRSQITEYCLGEHSEIRAIHAVAIQHSFPRHSHESYLIGTVLRGVRISISSGISALYKRGDIFCFEPFQEHSCSSGFNEGYDYIALSLPAEYFSKSGADDFWSGVAGWFKELFLKLPAGVVEFELERVIYDNLKEYNRCGWGSVYSGENDYAENMARSIEFINDNFALRIVLSDIAEYASMSKYNFQRVFSRTFGMSPAAYIDKRRVAEALTLINQGQSSAMAALACGFADQSHLCRVVKKVTGVTVKNYHKSGD